MFPASTPEGKGGIARAAAMETKVERTHTGHFFRFNIRLRVYILLFSFQSGENYRKIPKISPGAYILQRPFLRGLFLEGLIFGRAYNRREICVFQNRLG